MFNEVRLLWIQNSMKNILLCIAIAINAINTNEKIVYTICAIMCNMKTYEYFKRQNVVYTDCANYFVSVFDSVLGKNFYVIAIITHKLCVFRIRYLFSSQCYQNYTDFLVLKSSYIFRYMRTVTNYSKLHIAYLQQQQLLWNNIVKQQNHRQKIIIIISVDFQL